MTGELVTEKQKGDDYDRRNRGHNESTHNELINHSLGIEVHGAGGAAARTWIDHIAAITTGYKVHKVNLDAGPCALLQIATYAIINRSTLIVA